MKVIVYRNSEGTTSICRPAHGARLVSGFSYNGKHKLPGPVPFDSLVRQFKTDDLTPKWAESEDEFVSRIRKKDVPAGAEDVRIVDDADIPQDRTYRAALNPDLSFDMAKARKLHIANLRRDRAPLLAALDVEAIRADEINDAAKKRDVVARKKKLRDVTSHASLAAASTTEELKALTIDALSR